MTDKVYRQAFEQAKADLARAVARTTAAEKAAVTARDEAIHLRRTVAALAVLCGEDVEDSMGLTEAVRVVFQSRDLWITLKDLKEQVEALGVSLADLKNPDASVLSVLNRLVAAGEIYAGTRKAAAGQAAVRFWKPAAKKAEQEKSSADDDIPF
jgi:hypothetical protein